MSNPSHFFGRFEPPGPSGPSGSSGPSRTPRPNRGRHFNGAARRQRRSNPLDRRHHSGHPDSDISGPVQPTVSVGLDSAQLTMSHYPHALYHPNQGHQYSQQHDNSSATMSRVIFGPPSTSFGPFSSSSATQQHSYLRTPHNSGPAPTTPQWRVDPDSFLMPPPSFIPSHANPLSTPSVPWPSSSSVASPAPHPSRFFAQPAPMIFPSSLTSATNPPPTVTRYYRHISFGAILSGDILSGDFVETEVGHSRAMDTDTALSGSQYNSQRSILPTSEESQESTTRVEAVWSNVLEDLGDCLGNRISNLVPPIQDEEQSRLRYQISKCLQHYVSTAAPERVGDQGRRLIVSRAELRHRTNETTDLNGYQYIQRWGWVKRINRKAYIQMEEVGMFIARVAAGGQLLCTEYTRTVPHVLSHRTITEADQRETDVFVYDTA